MNEFKNHHPAVSFIYFIAVIGFSMFFMHPITLTLGFAGAFLYALMTGGRSMIKFCITFLLPLMIVTALINPVFSHEGMTVLYYLPSGNPLTAESIYYGAASAVMIGSAICLFSSFNRIMTSDKFMYLFGKIIPSLSLVFSMVLRFVPKFGTQLEEVSNAQRCIGKDISHGNALQRAKNGISILSAMLTRSLENSIETSDSMKSRGYGLPDRTSFGNFRFDKRDFTTLIAIVILSVYVIAGIITGVLDYKYFPVVKRADISVYGISVFAAYGFLTFLPIIIEIKEALRWRALRLKA